MYMQKQGNTMNSLLDAFPLTKKLQYHSFTLKFTNFAVLLPACWINRGVRQGQEVLN